MANEILDILIDFFTNKSLIAFLASMLPVLELRGSIPIAILLLDMNWFHAFILSVAGNFLICIPLLYLLDIFKAIMSKNRYSAKIMNYAFNRANSKAEFIESYKYYGLMLFVAIPFPVTGAWTGCLISSILKMNRKKSLLFIMLGILISATIVTILTLFFNYIPSFINR